jgi:ATP-dependent DNA helicase RecG
VNLTSNVTELDGVASATSEKLRRLGIKTVKDLLLHIPRSYRDHSKLDSTNTMQPGMVTLKGRLENVRSRRSRRGQFIVEAAFVDDDGRVGLVWFNQPYLAQQLKRYSDVYISGELIVKDRIQLINPEVEPTDVDQAFTAQIVPQYPLTKGLSNKKLYRLVDQALECVEEFDDYLPLRILEQYELMTYQQMLSQLHRPQSQQSLAQAKHRWGFDELFELMLAARSNAKELSEHNAPKVATDVPRIKEFLSSLSFTLTDDQKRSLWQILQDLQSGQPMNRLLQGDVGSGKTVVAAAAADHMMEEGHQVAVIAPTEVVAHQHHQSLQKMLPDFKSVLLTSSVTKAAKRRRKNMLARGEAQLAVGTHALLQPDVEFDSLGLLVIDEQHRFGVNQRQRLVKDNDTLPHVLSMSATPIPRTLALTVYADLMISSIRELPPGRKPVETKVYGPSKRQFVYDQISEQIDNGHQVYVVCPLISESDKLGVTSVEKEHQRIRDYFKSSATAPLHGGLKSDEKQQVIDDFTSGKTDILVATTVVEVGVDVGNATVMLIEGAERFGLSQLHQLRGRVGRSDVQSYCYALTSSRSQSSKPRLQAFADTTSGFELAEYDMEHRGSGQLWGTAQSGQFSFQHARLADTRLVETVQAVVTAVLSDEPLRKDPSIKRIIDNGLKLVHRN